MQNEMTMLERATAAIEPKFAAMFSGETRRALAEEFARAVIASLREPSERIKRVGARHLYTLPLVDHEVEETADAWRLMVDAILEEGKK